jgi:peptide/nickel transport system permease protein
MATKTQVLTTKHQYRGVTRWQRIASGLGLYIPVTIFALMIICAIFANFLAPYGYNDTSLTERRLPPAWAEKGSMKHVLGTDTLGRDILSRAIYGARISLSVSLFAIVITAGIGTILGIMAGYMGGRVDAFIMRLTDIAMAFPSLLLAIIISVSLGPGFFTVIFALSILGWAGYARIIRGESMRLRNSDFVQQALISGASPGRIMVKHIFPNIVNVLIIGVTLSIGAMILAEAAMSYLGIGIPPPAPSWGNMVSDGRNELDRAWWISTFPGILIGLVVLSGNFLGDWLRDKLDPRLRQL